MPKLHLKWGLVWQYEMGLGRLNYFDHLYLEMLFFKMFLCRWAIAFSKYEELNFRPILNGNVKQSIHRALVKSGALNRVSFGMRSTSSHLWQAVVRPTGVPLISSMANVPSQCCYHSLTKDTPMPSLNTTLAQSILFSPVLLLLLRYNSAQLTLSNCTRLTVGGEFGSEWI